MARMTEITGEQARLAEPETAGSMIESQRDVGIEAKDLDHEFTGPFAPMRLRLSDFSGEGERAPPP